MYDATKMKNNFSAQCKILLEQGLADEFLSEELLTPHSEKTCTEQGQQLEVNYRADFDHSYYFISTFLKEHINFHLA